VDRSFPCAARFLAARRSVRRKSLMDDLMIGMQTTPFTNWDFTKAGTGRKT
jgi:hypothetical protein